VPIIHGWHLLSPANPVLHIPVTIWRTSATTIASGLILQVYTKTDTRNRWFVCYTSPATHEPAKWPLSTHVDQPQHSPTTVYGKEMTVGKPWLTQHSMCLQSLLWNELMAVVNSNTHFKDGTQGLCRWDCTLPQHMLCIGPRIHASIIS